MKDELENFIANNRNKLDEEKPDPAVLARILGHMQVEQQKQAKGILIPFRVLQWAAACVIILGGSIMFWALQKQQGVKTTTSVAVTVHNEIQKPDSTTTDVASATTVTHSRIIMRKSIDSVDEAIALHRNAVLAKYNTHKAAQKKLALFASLKNMDSPASRINATSGMYQLKNAGKDVVDALVQTLNTDPNANVRVAALDGLAKFYRDEYVRKKLISSLKKQQDPVVQIAMIELLTRMKESAILTELDKLVSDDNTIKAVKDCAYSSMFRLRSS